MRIWLAVLGAVLTFPVGAALGFAAGRVAHTMKRTYR